MEDIVLGRVARGSLSGEVTFEQKSEYLFILSEENDYTFLLFLALSLFRASVFCLSCLGLFLLSGDLWLNIHNERQAPKATGSSVCVTRVCLLVESLLGDQVACWLVHWGGALSSGIA